jgi:hypothetical protein
MPFHDFQIRSGFQATISDYIVDSAAATFLKYHDISWWIRSKDLPSFLPIKLDTSSMGFFFKGMKEHYGEHKPIDIEFELVDLKEFGVRAADESVSFHSDSRMNIYVNTSGET